MWVHIPNYNCLFYCLIKSHACTQVYILSYSLFLHRKISSDACWPRSCIWFRLVQRDLFRLLVLHLRLGRGRLSYSDWFALLHHWRDCLFGSWSTTIQVFELCDFPGCLQGNEGTMASRTDSPSVPQCIGSRYTIGISLLLPVEHHTPGWRWSCSTRKGHSGNWSKPRHDNWARGGREDVRGISHVRWRMWCRKALIWSHIDRSHLEHGRRRSWQSVHHIRHRLGWLWHLCWWPNLRQMLDLCFNPPVGRWWW